MRVPPKRPRLVGKQVVAIIRKAIEERKITLARFLAVARHYMFRVQSELVPLQEDGQAKCFEGGRTWHSRVEIHGRDATVHLRIRKTEPHGAVVARTCVCKSQGPILCGPCSLRAQIMENRPASRDPSLPVFDLDQRRSIDDLRRWAAAVGAERPSWHAMRRGMATDMLKSGSSVAQIVTAGGWRSTAFIRYFLREDIDREAACNFVVDHSVSEGD